MPQQYALVPRQRAAQFCYRKLLQFQYNHRVSIATAPQKQICRCIQFRFADDAGCLGYIPLGVDHKTFFSKVAKRIFEYHRKC